MTRFTTLLLLYPLIFAVYEMVVRLTEEADHTGPWYLIALPIVAALISIFNFILLIIPYNEKVVKEQEANA